MIRDSSIILLIAANLLPVFGVFFWDWDVFSLLFLFWCENVVIGLFGVLRTWLVAARANQAGGFFLGCFFLVHYGGFMMGHLVVLLGLFSRPALEGDQSDGLLATLAGVLDKWTLIAVGGLFLSHGWSFVTNFVQKREYASLNNFGAMAMPYKRMAITHVALIVGGILLVKNNEPWMGLIILLGMKIALDIMFHRREHRQLEEQS